MPHSFGRHRHGGDAPAWADLLGRGHSGAALREEATYIAGFLPLTVSYQQACHLQMEAWELSLKPLGEPSDIFREPKGGQGRCCTQPACALTVL